MNIGDGHQDLQRLAAADPETHIRGTERDQFSVRANQEDECHIGYGEFFSTQSSFFPPPKEHFPSRNVLMLLT